jgi:hypothetical protein
MIGKKNIVFGFIYLVFTAALGPYMIVSQMPAVAEAQGERQARMSELQQAAAGGFLDTELNSMSAEQIAKTNTRAILSLSASQNARNGIEAIKSGPHAHGNLEAMLNIIVGIALCFIAVPRLFKQVISWTFIAGAVMHAGLQYMAAVFQFAWAFALFNSPVAVVGPVLILAGLAMMGVAAFLGFRAEPVRDW